MRYREFERLGRAVSEVGYGMWGIAGGEGGWTGSDDESGAAALQLAVDLGCTFFDTAWIYGRGHSERLLGELLRSNPDEKIIVATKIPPKDRNFPPRRGVELRDVFPPRHIREYAERSLENLGVDSIDLLQFHVWEDAWSGDAQWQREVREMKRQNIIHGVGISVNRWEPTNGLQALQTGLIDTVQVIYNVFDQSPEDTLFPLCRSEGIGVIARVPFDEGALTGNLTKDSTWPDGDWRNGYFVPENLHPAVERADALKELVPEGMTLPEMVLRFILQNPVVTTVIPGMRTKQHVEENLAVSDADALLADLYTALRGHRWDRSPTWWSQ